MRTLWVARLANVGRGPLPFRYALFVNALLLMMAVCLGWFVSEWRDIVLHVDVTRDPEAGYRTITMANLRVLAMMVAGVLTGGVYTAIQLATNGFSLGLGLSSVHRTAADLLPLAFRYVPIEFGALLLAASASHILAADVVACLAGGRRIRGAQIGVALVAAVVLVLVAAGIEVDARRTLVDAHASDGLRLPEEGGVSRDP